jgi:hypothetical protein
MTNLLDKKKLANIIEQVRDAAALKADPVISIGVVKTCSALLDGLAAGVYDAKDENVLAECAVVRYSEDEVEDTVPEEAPAGVLMLPPCPTKEEEEELIQWAANNGFVIVKHG